MINTSAQEFTHSHTHTCLATQRAHKAHTDTHTLTITHLHAHTYAYSLAHPHTLAHIGGSHPSSYSTTFALEGGSTADGGMIAQVRFVGGVGL